MSRKLVFTAASVCLLFLCLHYAEGETLQQHISEAERELKVAKDLKWIVKKAKNVILFVGDGMSDTTVTTGRIYKGQQAGGTGVEGWLSFDQFPHIGRSKTWTESAAVAASAGTACAMLCGAKPQETVVCLGPKATRINCSLYDPADNLKSYLYYAQEASKRTGVVTNTRITHATPANAYAHTPDRNIESDADLNRIYPGDTKGKCVDIAYQLVTKGKNVNVIMGGGRRSFLPNNFTDLEGSTGRRLDGMNLIDKWRSEHPQRASYVWNKTEFDSVKAADTDYLLGLFEASHMKYEYQRVLSNDEPSLAEMTVKAIDILKRGTNGFFLMVEGGRIDHAHHDGIGNAALLETVAFDDAVAKAISMTNIEDTLIIVTADHGHAMVFAGYTARNVSVNGINVPYYSGYKPEDNKNSTVLLYIDGPGAQNSTLRVEPSLSDVSAMDYTQQALIPIPISEGSSHTGEDVNIYARGPMAHFFHTTHEQHYIMHVMKFASCLDKYSNEPHCFAPATPGPDIGAVIGIIVGLAIVVVIGVVIGIIVLLRMRRENSLNLEA